MANPFEVDVVNPLQALMQGQQAYATTNKQFLEGQKTQARQQAFQDYQSGNPQSAIGRLLQIGDTEGVAAIGTIEQRKQQNQFNERDFAFKQAQAEREQKNADRSYGLQARSAARADEDKPIIKEAVDASGNTTFYRINPRSGEATAINPTGAPQSAGGNPFGSGKFNEGQGKAAGFTDRMLQSEAILAGGPSSGAPMDTQGASMANRGLSQIPVVGNYLVGSDYQKYDQAKKDFINAQLRRESGAAISSSEFDNADSQYFPKPGDSPEVIAQKRANRRAAVEAMGREGGQAYRPKSVYGTDGKVMPYGQPQAQPQNPPAQAAPTQQQPSGPAIGTVQGGYRYKGGNPADPNSWVKQ